MNKTVEIFSSNDHRSRYEYTYIRPFVVQVIFLQHMVEESESSTLTSHRTATTTREPYRVVVRVRSISSYYTKCLIDTIVVNKTYIHLPHVLDICIVFYLQCTDRSAHREQAACKQPFGEIVIIAQSPESSRTDGRYDAFKSFKITRTRYLFSCTWVTRNEIAKTELPLNILAYLLS